MRRAFFIAIAGLLVLGLVATTGLMGKGHVPAGKTQFCHAGTVIEVGQAASTAHLNHGDAALPADDPSCIYFKGDSCDNDSPCPNQGD